MKPTVGRIVHFFPDEYSDSPLAAIITRVHSDECVNLHIFCDGSEPTRAPEWQSSMMRRREGNPTGVWDWPERV